MLSRTATRFAVCPPRARIPTSRLVPTNEETLNPDRPERLLGLLRVESILKRTRDEGRSRADNGIQLAGRSDIIIASSFDAVGNSEPRCRLSAAWKNPAFEVSSQK